MHSEVSDVPGVLPDFVAIGKLAAQHLMARGLYQLGFLGMQRLRDSARAYTGMKEASEKQQPAKISRLLIPQSHNRNFVQQVGQNPVEFRREWGQR
ncbi:MAG: DNA-binding LacI/PurR family transcriptional regulator [Verrucomicrobiales bacterium]|jgi:DNA-binding LacI/PurR family transcriptional regulator